MIENTETIHPDGSRVIVIADHKNNRVEMREYDPHGNFLRSTYGMRSDEPEVPDDEFDDLIAYLEKHPDANNADYIWWRDSQKEE